jgi:hypothetical protein
LLYLVLISRADLTLNFREATVEPPESLIYVPVIVKKFIRKFFFQKNLGKISLIFKQFDRKKKHLERYKDDAMMLQLSMLV